MTNDLLEDLKQKQDEKEFDQWGRRLIIPCDAAGNPKPDAKRKGYQRVTTFIDVMESTYNLERYKVRMTMLGLVEREDLALEVASWAPEFDTKAGKRELNRIGEKAQEAAKGSAAANTGTAMHKLTEYVDQGKAPKNVPAAYRKDLEAYRMAMEDFEVVRTEGFIVDDALEVSGRFDRVLRAKADKHGLTKGGLYIADLKTPEELEWSQRKIAMQLATYAGGELYDYETGVRTSLDIEQDWGIVMHLPRGKGVCHVLRVPLELGRWAVAVALKVRKWRALRNILVPVATYKADG